jgi:methionyl-tRNA formyltransferase
VLAYAPIWNIHPSLLPDLRGPDPLFYVARGDAQAGITIHQMDAQFDTGPIVAQQSIDITGCVSEADLIRVHAQLAATHWLAVSAPIPTGNPQPSQGIYAPLPQATDFTLAPHWSQQRTRQFMQLTNLRRRPYWVAALQRWVSGLHPFGVVEIPCHDGILRADTASAPQ